MTTTPNIGLTLLEAAQAQKHVSVNAALTALDDLRFARSQTLDLSAATETTLEFPERCQVLGVSYRFTADVTYSDGGSTVTIGDDGDGVVDGVAANASRYASGLTGGAGSSGVGPVTAFPIFGAMTVKLTPDTGAIAGGTVILTLHALLLPAPAAP